MKFAKNKTISSRWFRSNYKWGISTSVLIKRYWRIIGTWDELIDVTLVLSDDGVSDVDETN